MSASPARTVAAVVVAGGKGERAGADRPKQFALHRGVPLLRHSVTAMAAAGIEPIAVVLPADHLAEGEALLRDIAGVICVTGGVSRQQSVQAGLDALQEAAPDLVLIHDAARPGLRAPVIERLVAALDSSSGAIPVLPVADSLLRDGGCTVLRDGLFRVQTPQAFRYAEIVAAHRAWQGETPAGDDAEVARAAGIEVAMVEGDEALAKVTYPGDLAPAPAWPRTGSGFDVHRLVAGEELWLCGVRIEHTHGLSGHSDADVAIHALVDAMLGALALGDIGDHFPPSDPQWRGASSDRFLTHAAQLARVAGYAVGNVDVTIICEAPRIGPHRHAMRETLARILAVDIAAVSVKATTSERLGFAGRGEGIAAQAVATMIPCSERTD